MSNDISQDELLEKLRGKVSLRDQMGGSLYWNILNDECCQIANECLANKCERASIEGILGKGTSKN